MLSPPRSRFLTLMAVLLAAATASAPGAKGRSQVSAPAPSAASLRARTAPTATHHAMTDEEMNHWVESWYAAHPRRGEASAETAVDTFLAVNNGFDADGSSSTVVDVVRIEPGQTVLWKWVNGAHTVTNGEDFNDPNLGVWFDQPLRDTDPEFSFRFDSIGTFPFFCRPHLFFEMRGVVVVAGPDTTPPQIQITSPNGGELLPAHLATSVSWTATDDVGVASVDLFYRDAEGAPWTTLARELTGTSSFPWFVHHTPGPGARVLAVVRDAAGNQASDTSDAPFTIDRLPGGRVATTLRDFIQPGTQPLDGGGFDGSDVCLGCHGGYAEGVEPGAWKGTMMSQSARDPLFHACLAIAEQDAPSSGDLCIRCHSPVGWLSGRSVPTDGSRLTALDRDGVSCQFCHRLTDPVYRPGVNPPADQAILGALFPAHRPTGYSNGQYVVDPSREMRRGPFTFTAAPHPFMESDFHRRSDLCGTCHDVSNPVFERQGPADYAPGPLDARADSIGAAWLMPIERTYSEWRNSAYPAGVYAPEFAGSKPFGIVSTCQDCHERDVVGQGCNPDSFPQAPVRDNLPFHDMMGGNAWMALALANLPGLLPGEVDPAAQARAAARATEMLRKAALLDVTVVPAGDSAHAKVTITNRTGHKLPTGYPEGRRMWLEVRARDASGALVYHSGAYEDATGTLIEDPDAVIYEAHLGLSPGWAASLGLSPGPSFHFVLNDTLYKDNRIPPRGFTVAAFEAFGGAPVDDTRAGLRYADGQHWDESLFRLPASARSVAVALRYQSVSKEYVEFLRDENRTNDAGQRLYDLWAASGRGTPVLMAYDSVAVEPAPAPSPSVALRALANPFRDDLRLELALARPSPVTLEIFDARGRRVWSRAYGVLGGGAHVLVWPAQDAQRADAGTGPFWARVRAGSETLRQKVVRVR